MTFNQQSKSFALSNNSTIPAVGYGTGTKWYKYGDNTIDSNLVSILKTAISSGFTHIDGAEVYYTDQEIGKAIKESGKSRDSLFVTDKYFAGDGTYTGHSKESNPFEALKAALKRFGLDYVDLYLIHSPFIKTETHGFSLEESWKFLEKCVSEGLAKNIGVSNFAVKDLETILKVADIKPVINQIEFNAYLQDQTPGIVEFSQSHNILLEAYSPLAPLSKGEKGPLSDTIEKLSKKYGKTDTQVLLRWVIEKGILPITTSSNSVRIKEILDIFDFELTTAEVDEITELGKSHGVLRQYWIPEFSHYDK